jgi:flagellar biogenesis protein FliO
MLGVFNVFSLFVTVPPELVETAGSSQEALRTPYGDFIVQLLLILPLAWILARLLVAFNEKTKGK